MVKLILVRHAPPEITPEAPSRRWVLSEEGRRRCGWLAKALAAQGVKRLYASLEPKALETAALVGVALGLEVRPRHGLQENDRTGLAFGSVGDLNARIQRFFAEPAQQVIGRETAGAALARFDAAVRDLWAETPNETAAIVTHGTVLSLLAARYNRIDPFDFWTRLSAPAYVAMDGETFKFDGPVHHFPA